jgi:hypothetical protein
MFKACRKNFRVARSRISDNHSVKRGHRPLRRKEACGGIQIIEVIGMVLLFIGLASINYIDGSINWTGVAMTLLGGGLTIIADERGNN